MNLVMILVMIHDYDPNHAIINGLHDWEKNHATSCDLMRYPLQETIAALLLYVCLVSFHSIFSKVCITIYRLLQARLNIDFF